MTKRQRQSGVIFKEYHGEMLQNCDDDGGMLYRPCLE